MEASQDYHAWKWAQFIQVIDALEAIEDITKEEANRFRGFIQGKIKDMSNFQAAH